MVQDVAPNLNCPTPVRPAGAQGIQLAAVDDAHARLTVTFYEPVTGAQESYLLNPHSYSLTGGRRLFPRVLQAEIYSNPPAPPDPNERRMVLTLDGLGDFSIYTLTVSGPDIDPFFSSRKLRFRLACDDPFDCREAVPPPPPAAEIPVAIDYLAKDYASFRQALLDFIPTRLPDWSERSEADIGMMLLELFAATADNLSYVQDRVANEAFLATATQRRSVAGHLALIGYQMDEGASAYTWLQFQVSDVHVLQANPGLRVSNLPAGDAQPVIVFETLTPTTLRPEHNRMALFTWDNQDCCLPRGSLSAALAGSYPDLQPGDYLLFDDGRGQREVVRLAARPVVVAPTFATPPAGGEITVVRWSAASALQHDYCAGNVAVYGNLVLATHGETVEAEGLQELTGRHCPGRKRFRLARGPLAHVDRATLALAAPLDDQPPSATSPAGAAFREAMPRSVSTLTIEVEGFTQPWQEKLTLLYSRPDDRVFRVEIDDQGEATVVFGNNVFGLCPPDGARVTATYRVGGGTAGNLGTGTLVAPQPRAQESLAWLTLVTNPMPATGGRDLESRDHARRFGPATFRQPLVAVTAADYQAAAQAYADASGQQPIQRANATFRWSGSWLTVTLAVDPRGVEGLTGDLRTGLLAYMDGRRLAGYDLEDVPPVYVPLEVAVEFCLVKGFLAADVQQRLLAALGSTPLAGGRTGFFAPDHFSFGDNLYVSQLYAAIMAVPGVESAEIARLARLASSNPDRDTAANLSQGYLATGPNEIVQLDNDRNFPEHGVLTVRPKGGIG